MSWLLWGMMALPTMPLLLARPSGKSGPVHWSKRRGVSTTKLQRKTYRARWRYSFPPCWNTTPVTCPRPFTSTCVTMQSVSTSAPSAMALGMWWIKELYLELGMHPWLQKPRLMQGGRPSNGAERMASGAVTLRMPSFSQPFRNIQALALRRSRSGYG